MRKKKTPEELAAEAEQEDLDDFTSKYSHPQLLCRLTPLSLNFSLSKNRWRFSEITTQTFIPYFDVFYDNNRDMNT